MQNNVVKNEDDNRAKSIDSYIGKNLSNLSQRQVMEFVLLYIFPRGDRVTLAQNLLERFGSVQNVLEAPEHSLLEVKGMNERAARMMSGFVKMFDYYTNGKVCASSKLQEWSDVYDICEGLVRFQPRENLFVIGIDAGLRKISHRKLGVGSTSTVALATDAICDFIVETKSSFIVLTHNHPGGSCKPSVTDKTTTDTATDVAKLLHCVLLDHAVVGNDGIFSIRFNKKVRSFVDAEDVKQLAKTKG